MELDSLYRSPNIVRMIKSRPLRWTGQEVTIEEGKSDFQNLTGKPTGERPLGIHIRRQDDNIIIDLKV